MQVSGLQSDRSAIDAATHYWADRRTTLKRLADRCGKAEFYSLGTPTHAGHPVTAKGEYAPTLGTGAYALEQSWHILWLFVAALLIAAVQSLSRAQGTSRRSAKVTLCQGSLASRTSETVQPNRSQSSARPGQGSQRLTRLRTARTARPNRTGSARREVISM